MFFPLIERRTFNNDRRAGNKDSHNNWRIKTGGNVNTDRRSGKERRVLKLDRETLLYGTLVSKETEPRQEKKQPKVITVFSLILVPLTIAVTSILVTHFINEKQIVSARIIAGQQRESAELIASGQRENAIKIANANIENSRTIADAQMETEHLQHIVSIFSNIISPLANEKQKVIHQRIRSLAVYGDEALPFLLQILRYSNSDTNSSESSGISEVANNTIQKIIKYSQLELAGQEIIGKADNVPINLRHKVYANYNLNKSKFFNVNLFKADFSGSSLLEAEFKDVDLQETNFQGANLQDVKFTKAKLSKTNFQNAYLTGVTFTKCKDIGSAIFSLNTLLQADEEPMKSIKSGDYTLLLMNYEKELKAIAKFEKGKLNDVLNKLGVAGIEQLQEKFKTFREKGLAGTKNTKPVRLPLNS